MKQLLLFTVFLFCSLFIFAQQNNIDNFYVGSYTTDGADGIFYCSFNTETGAVKMEKSFGGIANPSFLRLSPNRKFIYAVSEAGEKGSFVYAFKRDINGDLSLLNRQSSNGRGPCHVDVSSDGRFVATATYGAGTTALFPVATDGSLNEAATVNVNKGSGPNEGRQKAPHAHSIKFSRFNNQVFSADLGTDHLDIYKLENNKLKTTHQKFVQIPPGAGPRHFDFHPSEEVVYVINELNSTISCLRVDNGKWEVFQNISTLPENFEGDSYCADIHISKDGKYLYGSNRGHNSIAVYEVNKDYHTLERLGNVSVEGNWPRNFSLSPDGKWMLVANQKSEDITVFKINHETGVPEFAGKKLSLPSPVCIEFL